MLLSTSPFCSLLSSLHFLCKYTYLRMGSGDLWAIVRSGPESPPRLWICFCRLPHVFYFHPSLSGCSAFYSHYPLLSDKHCLWAVNSVWAWQASNKPVYSLTVRRLWSGGRQEGNADTHSHTPIHTNIEINKLRGTRYMWCTSCTSKAQIRNKHRRHIHIHSHKETMINKYLIKTRLKETSWI